jgi:hypothetical protein
MSDIVFDGRGGYPRLSRDIAEDRLMRAALMLAGLALESGGTPLELHEELQMLGLPVDRLAPAGGLAGPVTRDGAENGSSGQLDGRTDRSDWVCRAQLHPPLPENVRRRKDTGRLFCSACVRIRRAERRRVTADQARQLREAS